MPEERPDRESIWSVNPGAKTWYFVLFSAQVLVGLALLFRETGELLPTWERGSSIVVTSAAFAIMATEGWRAIMVIADVLRERFDRQREKRRQETLAQGRKEERDKWAAWNTRRLEAEESGERFDEPPPLN